MTEARLRVGAGARRPPSTPTDPPPRAGRLAAVASTAIASLLGGVHQDLRVVAAFPRAAYLSVGDDLVTLETSDGVGQPNAVVVNAPSTLRPLARIFVGQTGRIGDGGVRLGDLEIRVSRWWDPRPRLRPTTAAGLRAVSEITRRRIEATADGVRPRGDVELEDALAEAPAGTLAALTVGTLAALTAGDDVAAFTAARRMIGLGPGLTPSGDDRLAGLIAGTLVLAPSFGSRTSGSEEGGGVADLAVHAEVVAAAQRLGRAVAQAAVGRTTSVSAALLWHAARGQLARPATDVVRAWTSPCGSSGFRGFRVASVPAQSHDPTRNTRNTRNTWNTRDADADIVRATDRLLAVGSSSGRDLTLGLLAAADLLTGTIVTSTPTASPDAPRTHLTRRTS